MKLSPEERAHLRQVQKELAKVLRETGVPRPEALAAAGIKESAFDSAWSRGSVKLVWVIKLLLAHGVEPREFFASIWGGAAQAPESDPPYLLQLAKRRSERT